MYKNYTVILCRVKPCSVPKILLMMKLICVLLITSIMQVSASGFAQVVSLKKKNAAMKEVFNDIQKQTGFSFIISSELLKKAIPTDVNLNKVPIKESLERYFSGQPFDYVIKGKMIIVNEKQLVKPISIEVSGKVTDEKGLALTGVSVIVKNTKIGTVTDVHGNYKITIPNQDAIIVYSFLGFVTQEFKVGNRKQLNVRLKEQIQSLGEAVVIGYGTVNKADLTGAVGQLKLEDVKKAPVGAFTEALAGRIAGVQVSSNEGQPGSLPIITIRGAGSLTQSSAPLYVVDGSPVESFDAGSINADDIMSLTVLKDASATAIYGARASNGVIVIETKKGREGKPEVNFNVSAGTQEVRKFIEVMNPYEFVKYQAELYPLNATNNYFQNGRDLEYYRTIKGADWQRQLIGTGKFRKAEMSIRGGSKDTRFSISGAGFDQKGIIVNTDAARYNGRISIDHTFNKKLTGGVITALTNTKIGGIQSSVDNAGYRNFLFYSAWGYRPVSGNNEVDFLDENVDDIFDPSNPSSDIRVNPVKNAKNTYRQRSTTDFSANGYLNYNITKDLILRARGNIITYSDDLDEFYNSKTVKGNPDNPLNTMKTQAGITYTDVSTWSNDNTLTYSKRIKKVHSISALAGFSLYSSKRKIHGVSYMNIPDEELGMSGIEKGTPYTSIASRTNFTLASFFGRLNYNYKSKYLFTGTWRADGSSKFPYKNRWGYFPSAALAWNMKNESFLKNSSIVSNSKLRVSYGITGNNRVSEFDYLPSLQISQFAAYSYKNGAPIDGLVPGGLGNSDLRWESTHQTDIGYDLGLFKDRVSLTVDLYRKQTNDLLLDADLPAITGYTKVFKNIGKIRNDGIELSLNTLNIKNKNFEWQTSFNISFNKNKVIELADGQKQMFTTLPFETNFKNALYVAEIGSPAAMFYGYVWEGNYQFADFNNPSPGIYVLKDDIPDNGAARANIQPGDIKYKDINGDLKVNSLDMVHMGSGMPIHFGGLTNSFNYKNFDLNVFFQWSYGNKIFNANRVVLEGNTNAIVYLNQYASYANRWTPENNNNEYYRTNGQGPPGMYSTRTIEDGSYLRLKTLSLGYSLPNQIINKLKMRSLRFVLSGQNLLTFTNYSGMDPEASARNSILTPGFDYSSYPHARTLVLGINASF